MNIKLRRPVVITSYDAEVDNDDVNTLGNVEDSYLEKVVKYIPSEIVAVYLTLSGLIVTLPIEKKGIENGLWILFVALLLLTPFYWGIANKDAKIRLISRRYQTFYAMLAFFVWVLALGGPFQACCEAVIVDGLITSGWWIPIWGTIAISVVTFLSPLIEKFFFWAYKRIKALINR